MSRAIAALEEHGCRSSGATWTCPAHDDATPSLSVTEGEDGRVLLNCHAGCSFDAIVESLALEKKDLFERSAQQPKSHVLKTYDYLDEEGKLLYQVCRYVPKGFKQRRPGADGQWIWNLQGVRRVPYKLPEILSNPDARVFLVEGEKDADRLHESGLLATTSPGGAGKWRDEYAEFLRGRDVIVVPDNDDAGRTHARDVATSVLPVAKSVRILDLPDLEEKGDVSDWLETHSREELEILADAASAVDPGQIGGIEAESTNEGREGSGGRESIAKKLIPLVLAAGIELFHDQRKDSFAAVPMEGGRRIFSLRSRTFSDWLFRISWIELNHVLNSEQLSGVRNVLSGKALFEGSCRELGVRCALHERAVWIDLDGRRAVRVRPGRWEVIDKPPILFRPFAHQRPLPEPIQGGDPKLVLRFVNLRNEGDKILFLSYLVAGLVPNIPIVALIVHGLQGSAKTTLLKIVKRLLDPSAVAVRGGVHDQTEFALAASQNRVLFFDNLTSVPDWLSDALCRAVTGEGWSKRTLYSDEDATVLEYRGLVGLSGINLVSDRADLLDRALIMELEPVAPNERLQERELWRNFEAVRPHIVGGLLDALARAMQVEPGLMLRSLPRMADFARWGTAAAVGLRLSPFDFLRAYEANVGRQNQAAVDANPVAQAVLSLMMDRTEWVGNPGRLLEDLERVADALHISTKDRTWPRNPSWLTRRIRQVQPNLLALGIRVLDDRSGQRRTLTLKKDVNAVTPGTRGESGDAGFVGNDGIMTPRNSAVTDAVKENMLIHMQIGGDDGSDSTSAASLGSVVETGLESDPEEIEERAAILEYDGGFQREVAERKAREHETGSARERTL